MKSRRRVEFADEIQSIPGGFDTAEHPSSAIAGPGKRKARDDEGEVSDPAEEPRVSKAQQKKRVRVVDQEEEELIDEDMDEAEPEPVRRVGEEWTSEGVKYKMSEDNLVLREGFIKEQKEVDKSVSGSNVISISLDLIPFFSRDVVHRRN